VPPQHHDNVVARYFKTLQIPLIDAANLLMVIDKGAQRVIIVNERMAQMLWPGENALATISSAPKAVNAIQVSVIAPRVSIGPRGRSQALLLLPMPSGVSSGMTYW